MLGHRVVRGAAAGCQRAGEGGVNAGVAVLEMGRLQAWLHSLESHHDTTHTPPVPLRPPCRRRACRPGLGGARSAGADVPGPGGHALAAAGAWRQRQLRLGAAVAGRASRHGLAGTGRGSSPRLSKTFGPGPRSAACASVAGPPAGACRMSKLPHACLFAALAVASFGATAQEDAEVTDPYQWLEDVEGEKQLAWVRGPNAKAEAESAETAGFKALEADLLAIYASDDEIPGVYKQGDWYYNFWKDTKHERGRWRRTTLEEYRKPQPKWETVLDLDALNKAE